MTKLLSAPLYAVSDEWEHNGYDDSDFYRVVFNPNTGALSRELTHSTRFASGYCMEVTGTYAKVNGLQGYVAHELRRDFDGKKEYCATVNRLIELPVYSLVMPKDTPERVWQAAEQAYADLLFKALLGASVKESVRATKGKLAEVVSGRKIPKGETVTVLGNPVPDVYGRHNNGEKVLVQSATKGALKTNVKNLRVIDSEKYVAPQAELIAKAREIAAQRNFYPLFRTSGVSMV